MSRRLEVETYCSAIRALPSKASPLRVRYRRLARPRPLDTSVLCQQQQHYGGQEDGM